MVKNTANPDAADEFWRDDAVAIAERERAEVMGFRMPAVASSKPAASARAAAMSPKAERRSVSFGLIAFVVVGVSIVGLILFSLASRPVVTLREFDQLAVGMTPEECERIIGSEGKRNMSMQSTLPGFSTSGEDRQWVNADDSYAGVVFMNGKLQTKLQVGLK